jgi:hypothetical protein
MNVHSLSNGSLKNLDRTGRQAEKTGRLPAFVGFCWVSESDDFPGVAPRRNAFVECA